jgi:hypothetical protein
VAVLIAAPWPHAQQPAPPAASTPASEPTFRLRTDAVVVGVFGIGLTLRIEQNFTRDYARISAAVDRLGQNQALPYGSAQAQIRDLRRWARRPRGWRGAASARRDQPRAVAR